MFPLGVTITVPVDAPQEVLVTNIELSVMGLGQFCATINTGMQIPLSNKNNRVFMG